MQDQHNQELQKLKDQVRNLLAEIDSKKRNFVTKKS